MGVGLNQEKSTLGRPRRSSERKINTRPVNGSARMSFSKTTSNSNGPASSPKSGTVAIISKTTGINRVRLFMGLLPDESYW